MSPGYFGDPVMFEYSAQSEFEPYHASTLTVSTGTTSIEAMQLSVAESAERLRYAARKLRGEFDEPAVAVDEPVGRRRGIRLN